MNSDRYRSIVVTIALLVISTCAFGQGPTQKRIQRVENGLRERMAFYKVPGVSIAVINNGRLEWARGYGVLEAGSSRPVTTATLFQACSISKPVAAMAALELVEQGRLNLDEDINRKLSSWKMPENDFTKEQRVTLRRLLTHTAGTTVTGLRGYAADEQIPTLRQILEGVKPATQKRSQLMLYQARVGVTQEAVSSSYNNYSPTCFTNLFPRSCANSFCRSCK